MELQFYFGGSGAGKSKELHDMITKWADREPERSFLFLVPDQFTMQTQIDLVEASTSKGIMNIDVLSFGRLAHRIFEETGYGNKPVLDDTGKSLVLRKVTAKIKDKLPVIGGNLNKIGYIHEVKSALSEFMQYGISTDRLSQLSEYAQKRGALYYKLKDLEVIYRGFLDYVKEQFITTEETLELLTGAVGKSRIIKNSVIVFDGFTGFTPIQYGLIQELFKLTERVIFSITIDIHDNPMYPGGEQELFYLSKKTVKDLCRLADEAGIKRAEDVYLHAEPLPRFLKNPEMAHLEKSLFRYPIIPYEEECKAIRALEALNPSEEARQVCIQIKELVLSRGYSYRDIALVTGDMETYGGYLERESKVYGIPLFMDQTRGVLLNPFIEYIRSSLRIIMTDFSYQAVFHYIRTGLSDFGKDEADRLENYVLALGIKGKKRWSESFTRKPKADDEEQIEYLDLLNQSRSRLMEQLKVLMVKKQTAGEHVKALYDFIVAARIQEKLSGYEEMFKQNAEQEKAKEYAQIYRLVMELLEQIDGLLGGESMTQQEFADILDAGFSELKVGIIPGSVDRIVVGDVERTRLKQVKVLFFMGINDGNIPKNGSKGGIISDIDREFLQESGIELAPTPRQQMYIQRLYLYMNLTKPSELVFMSYARTGSDGKALRPSYLIDMIQRLFPHMEIKRPELFRYSIEEITGEADGLRVLAQSLRKYVETNNPEAAGETYSLYQLYKNSKTYGAYTDKLLAAAFMQYEKNPLSQAVAKALYGSMLENSVSRLERYAACAYSHFLQYGLLLKEREEYGFEQVDLGNVFHGVLELFAGKLAELNYTWFDFPREAGEKLLREALEACTAEYGETVLYSNARNEYRIERIYRILKRTIQTLQTQLKSGQFIPSHFEMSFSRIENLDAVNIALSADEKMKLKGRIDRIDTYEDEEHVYVKVIDYKSGNKKFDLAALYYGLQLQLVVYMNVAVESEKKRHPDKEIIPAALLYYHVEDPVIKEEGPLLPEDINERLLKELRMTGLVNDSGKVISLIDRNFTDKSNIVPVERKKDGSYSASSSVISQEDYQTVSQFVNHKIKEFGREILQGNISVNPCEQSTATACTWCAFKGVCGYDEKIQGYHTRELNSFSQEELMDRIKEEGVEAHGS